MMIDFDRFVARHTDGLLRTAYLVAWDEREAEDLVQECLFRLARRWTRVRTLEQPLASARRILVNLAADGAPARARRRVELELPTAGTEQSDYPFSALDDRVDMLAALAALSRRQRAVIVLRYFNGLTEAQIAEVLGCSQGTVKSSASRALARLREGLQINTPTL